MSDIYGIDSPPNYTVNYRGNLARQWDDLARQFQIKSLKLRPGKISITKNRHP